MLHLDYSICPLGAFGGDVKACEEFTAFLDRHDTVDTFLTTAENLEAVKHMTQLDQTQFEAQRNLTLRQEQVQASRVGASALRMSQYALLHEAKCTHKWVEERLKAQTNILNRRANYVLLHHEWLSVVWREQIVTWANEALMNLQPGQSLLLRVRPGVFVTRTVAAIQSVHTDPTLLVSWTLPTPPLQIHNCQVQGGYLLVKGRLALVTHSLTAVQVQVQFEDGAEPFSDVVSLEYQVSLLPPTTTRSPWYNVTRIKYNDDQMAVLPALMPGWTAPQMETLWQWLVRYNAKGLVDFEIQAL